MQNSPRCLGGVLCLWAQARRALWISVLFPTIQAMALDPALPPGGNFDLSHWYLGLPDSSASSVTAAKLVAGYTNATWFYTGADGAMVFWAPADGGTTSGSGYPRSELREQISAGSSSLNWTTSGTHILDGQCKILQAPSTQRVVFGQIHSYLGNAYELIVFKYIGGSVQAEIRNSPNATDKTFLPMGPVALGELITYRIQLQDGVLSLSLNGTTQSVNVLQLDPAWSQNTFYFKAGSYCQDNSGPSDEGSRVAFYQLQATHFASPPPPAPPTIVTQPVSQMTNAAPNVWVKFQVVAQGSSPLFYQWRKDGTELSDATNAMLVLSNIAVSDAGGYQVVLTNNVGSITSKVATLTVFTAPDPSVVGEALDTPGLTWTTSGAPAWFSQTNVTHDGEDAMQSGPIGDSKTTSLQTTVTGPGVLGFWWRVSSEPSNDRLLFYVSSSEKARITGETDWQWRTFSISSGSQVLLWTYSKNSSKAGGVDRAWLDQVRFIPNTPITPPIIAIQPVGTNVDSAANVTFTTGAMGSPTLKYQWQREGTNLVNSSSDGISGATTATLALSSVTPARAGIYTVIVSNSAGAVTSTGALLTVPPVPTLAEALDTTNLIWTTTGTPLWVGQSSVSHDGVDAARIGAVSDKKSATLQTTVQGPGTLSFWWKVSSETNKDILTLTANGSKLASLSGEAGWQFQVFNLPPAGQVLQWTYTKDKSKAAGQDRAWVDNVQFISTNITIALPAADAIAEAITRANDYYIATTTFQSNGWARGVYQTGNMRAYDVLQLDRFRAYAQQWGEYFQWKGGFRGRTNADGQVCGQTYFDLYLLDPQPVRLADIKTGLDSRLAVASVDDWWWIDAFYMAGPVYARYSKLYETNSYLAKMGQFYQDMKVRRGLFSPAYGLWYRDAEAKAATTSHGLKQFWGRGNGWVIAALARVLEQMPDDHPDRAEYVSMLQTMAAALKPLQGSDGFWRASLIDPTEVPNPETSATALITFALAWGIRHGQLDAAEYQPVVAKAWNGLVTLALHADGQVGFAQPQGHIPEPADYATSNDHGTGAFLLASSEVYLLVQSLSVPPAPLAASPVASTVFVRINVDGGQVMLTWDGTPKKTYRVFYTDALASPEWTPLLGEIDVTGSTARTVDASGSPQRFYRVVVE